MTTDRPGCRATVVALLTATVALPLAVAAAVAAVAILTDAGAGFARTALVSGLAFVAVGAGTALLAEAVLVALEWRRDRAERRVAREPVTLVAPTPLRALDKIESARAEEIRRAEAQR